MATLILIRSFPAPNILFYSIVSFSLLLCASIWTHNNYIEQQFHDEMEELYRDDVEVINKLPDIQSKDSNHIVLINDKNAGKLVFMRILLKPDHNCTVDRCSKSLVLAWSPNPLSQTNLNRGGGKAAIWYTYRRLERRSTRTRKKYTHLRTQHA